MAYFGRGTNKYIVDYGSDQLYKDYVEYSGNPYNLSKKQYRKVWKEFSKKLWDNIIFQNYEFVMPFRLGTIRMKYYKAKLKVLPDGSINYNKVPVDYKSTIEYWDKTPGARERKELLYFFNEHSDGYMAKVLWDRLTCVTRNHNRYAFRATRTLKRTVVKAIKEHKVVYYQ